MSATPSLAVFRHRAYLQYWLMRVFGGAAMQMLAVVIAWQAYDIARLTMPPGPAAAILGLVGLAQFLPLFVLSLVGGVAADRLDRKLILVVSLAIRIGVLIWLFVISRVATTAILPSIFVAAVVLGGLNAFFPAAASSLLPRLVPREELPQAIAWSSFAFQTSAIAGPAVGGLLLIWGPQAAYGACIGLISVAALLIATAPTPPHERVADARTASMILEGLRYVRDNKIVLGAISLDLVVVLFGGAMALLPVFAKDILHVGPSGLGLLRAAPAIGAACLAAILATRAQTSRLLLWIAGFLVLAPIMPALAHAGLDAGWAIARVTGLVGEAALKPSFDPVFVETLHLAPVSAAASIGMMLLLRPLESRVGRWMLSAIAVFGLATLAIAVSHWFWLTFVALAIRGASDMISVYVRQSLVQLATPDAMRGRVSSVSYIFISASNELGEFEAGVAAFLLGPVGAVLLGGGVAIGSALAWPRLFPQLADTDRFEDAAPQAATAPSAARAAE